MRPHTISDSVAARHDALRPRTPRGATGRSLAALRWPRRRALARHGPEIAFQRNPTQVLPGTHYVDATPFRYKYLGVLKYLRAYGNFNYGNPFVGRSLGLKYCCSPPGLSQTTKARREIDVRFRDIRVAFFCLLVYSLLHVLNRRLPIMLIPRRK